jgi:hypothetical protein
MTTQLIITEKCQGLYKDPEGAVKECGHPISHRPDECGPDTIARPYTPSVEPTTPGQAPQLPAYLLMTRMLGYIAQKNNSPGPVIHTTPAATLLAFAALFDQHQRPIRAEEVAFVLGNAPSSVTRHLRECSLVKWLGRGQFRPETLTVPRRKTES